MVTAGKRKKKNWFRPGMIIAQTRPMNQALNVPQGMSGSSVLATAERTSGYGESSSVHQSAPWILANELEAYRGTLRQGRGWGPQTLR